MDIFTAIREFGVFQAGLLLGILLGAVYDLLRIMRRIVPHGAVLTFIGDFLYVLFFWAMLFTFSVGAVHEIRYYTAAAVSAGFFAQRFAVGNYAVKLLGDLGVFLRDRLLIKPIGFIAKTLNKAKCAFVKSD